LLRGVLRITGIATEISGGTGAVMMNVVDAGAGGSADWIGEVAARGVLDAAFAWLCDRRKAYPDSADIWNLRRN